MNEIPEWNDTIPIIHSFVWDWLVEIHWGLQLKLNESIICLRQRLFHLSHLSRHFERIDPARTWPPGWLDIESSPTRSLYRFFQELSLVAQYRFPMMTLQTILIFCILFLSFVILFRFLDSVFSRVPKSLMINYVHVLTRMNAEWGEPRLAF